MTMKCPACGKDNAQGIKFCKKCGAYLAWSPNAAEAASDFQPTIMVPDSVDPDSDATVIRPVARATARHAPDTVPTQADPLLDALAGQPGPNPSPDRSDGPEAPSETHAPDNPSGASKAPVIIGGLVLLLAIGAGAAYWWLGQESTPVRARPVEQAPAQPMAAPTPPPPRWRPRRRFQNPCQHRFSHRCQPQCRSRRQRLQLLLLLHPSPRPHHLPRRYQRLRLRAPNRVPNRHPNQRRSSRRHVQSRPRLRLRRRQRRHLSLPSRRPRQRVQAVRPRHVRASPSLANQRA